MKAILIYGAPASGKSTLAKEYIKDGFIHIERDKVRFEIVMPGGNWETYRFNNKTEKLVTRLWNQLIDEAAFNGQNIVISDTQCNKDRRRNLVDNLENLGYTVYTVMLDIPLETLIERDSKRGGFSVGRDVIEQKVKELNDGN